MTAQAVAVGNGASTASHVQYSLNAADRLWTQEWGFRVGSTVGSSPAGAGPTDFETRFTALAESWRRDTRFCSSLSEIYFHPAYQRIIGMGPVVLPLIFTRLRADLEMWFWALQSITAKNPAADASPGDVVAMRRAWLRWAQESGYFNDRSIQLTA